MQWKDNMLQNQTRCDKCNLVIHQDFVGHHQCGLGNCPVCKNAIATSEYWNHIKSHPGHENDSPPPRKTFDNRENRERPHQRTRQSLY